PEVDVKAVKTVERDRLAVPAALAAGQQSDRGNVRGQVEPLGRQSSLQGLPAVEREHPFGGVAVEFHIDAGESEVPAGDIGLGLERETAEAAAWRSRLFRPTQCVA